MSRALLVPALALLAAPMWAATVEDGHVQHVLLISVDGMHAVDLANWVAANPTSNLAKLSSSGITYTNALTGGGVASDSFPGLAGLVTGGFPGCGTMTPGIARSTPQARHCPASRPTSLSPSTTTITTLMAV